MNNLLDLAESLAGNWQRWPDFTWSQFDQPEDAELWAL
jgi:hypothetical protein